MAPPYGDVCRKAEDALAAIVRAYVDAHLSDVQVVTGTQGITETAVPRVWLLATSAEPENIEDLIFTGNWFVNLQVAVVTNYVDDTRATRELRAAELFDIILQPDLAELINNEADVTDFHAYGRGQNQLQRGMVVGSVDRSTDGNRFIETLSVQLYCRPST